MDSAFCCANAACVCTIGPAAGAGDGSTVAVTIGDLTLEATTGPCLVTDFAEGATMGPVVGAGFAAATTGSVVSAVFADEAFGDDGPDSRVTCGGTPLRRRPLPSVEFSL